MLPAFMNETWYIITQLVVAVLMILFSLFRRYQMPYKMWAPFMVVGTVGATHSLTKLFDCGE